MVNRDNIVQSRRDMSDDEQAEVRNQLAEILLLIDVVDQEVRTDCTEEDMQALYVERYGLVTMAMATAWMCGYETGILWDPINYDSMPEPTGTDWPVVYIELPTGQVSWHMPPHKHQWDGHTNEEKSKRIELFAADNGVRQDD